VGSKPLLELSGSEFGGENKFKSDETIFDSPRSWKARIFLTLSI